MYIPNDDTQNYKSVIETFAKTHLNESTNQNLLSQQIRNCYYKTLGTSVINIQMSPPSQKKWRF